MVALKDNVVRIDEYLEKKEDERIYQEGLEAGYNVFRANDETVRICLENEKKTPIPIPDDAEAYFKKLFRIED